MSTCQTAHTPGPWTEHFHMTNQRSRTGEWYFVGRHRPEDGVLANSSKNVTLKGPSNEATANARLIAAAPEMLEALERIPERVQELLDTEKLWLEQENEAEAAIVRRVRIELEKIARSNEAAIQKARGRE